MTKENYGRDDHSRCFIIWLAGGGAKGGHIQGETDDFSCNIVRDPVRICDFRATLGSCGSACWLLFANKIHVRGVPKLLDLRQSSVRQLK